jgi:adenylate cyclase class IV
MQVEVKALIDSQESYNTALSVLQEQFIRQDLQENHFLDTAGREFFAQGTILRIRLIAFPHANQQDALQYSSAKLMLKAHTHVEDGSQISWTAEEAIPVDTARAILTTPRQLYSLLHAANILSETILPRLEREVSKEHLNALEYVGSFSTLRTVCHFKSEAQPGLLMHIDKTIYPFGDRFEVEVPNITVPVHDVAAEVAAFLASNGVSYEFAEESKFQRFVHGMQATKSSSHMVQDVKVVLDNLEGVQRVSENLEPFLLSEKQQDNTFYDGFDDELAARGAFFRLRHELNGNRFAAVLKEHQDVDSGSQVNWTQELELSPDVAHTILHDPTGFLSLAASNTLAQSLKEKFGMTRLRSIGSFSTVRRVYAWENATSQPAGGLQLRVDTTTFPFGEHYEVEVTNISVPVCDVLAELEGVLRSLGVSFRVATESKLDCFLRGCSRRY